MHYTRFRSYLAGISLAILAVACQPALYPAAALKTDTDIKVSASLASDAQAEGTIAPYRHQLEQHMNRVIGYAPAELNGRSGGIETTLGNFVADLQQEQASALSNKKVDMGLITSGGLRAVIPKGNITVGHIFEVMPFENELLILTLSGATTQKLFDFAAEKKILSISNATYTIRDSKPTAILIGGKPFDAQRTYTVAISDYLANGGDNMTMLKEALQTEKAGILLRDAILAKIIQLTSQHKPVEAKLEGRVKVL